MTNLRTLIIFVAALFISVTINAQNKVATYHTIQKGETLYRLTQIYQVTAESICALNPGLSAENFQAGKTIAIPQGNGQVEQKKTVEVIESSKPEGSIDNCQEMHKVKRKETIYGIAQKYGLTEQEIRDANPELNQPNAQLQKGKYICIPFKKVKVTKEVEPENEELFAKNKPEVAYYGRMKVALMLPFSTPDKARKSSATMFYRGFMLAIDSLKNQGVNMELTICDTGRNEEKVDSLLREHKLQDLDLLFTPMITRSDSKLSDFSRKNQIRLVTTTSNQVNTNPYLFATNTSNSLLYEDVTKFFMRKFSKANIIILEMSDDNEKTSRNILTNDIKKALNESKINYKLLSLQAGNDAILKALEKGKQNVILPNSANLPLMKKLVAKWKKFVDDNSDYRITMFGHKEWLSMASEMKTQFYALDTYIYSKYWFNPGNAASKQLSASYQRWYNAKLPTIMPSVPAIGFDVAYYMIKGLNTYGTAFEKHMKDISIRPYQNFIEFEHMGTGGFANTKVGFVHFNKKLVNVEY